MFLDRFCFSSKENNKNIGTEGETLWCYAGNDWKKRVKWAL